MNRYKRKKWTKRTAIVGGIVLLFAGFAWSYWATPEKAAEAAVKGSGYTSIRFAEKTPVFLSDAKCSLGDVAVYRFVAIDPSGKTEVDVTVCGSPSRVGKVTAK